MVGTKMRSVLRMYVRAASGWMWIGPSQRTARPSTDAVVTRKRGAGRVPARKFHSVPAWRKTSIGPIAVEEKVPSRNKTVTSVIWIPPRCGARFWRCGLITYVGLSYPPPCFKAVQRLFSEKIAQTGK